MEDAILTPTVSDYLARTVPARDPLLARLEQEARDERWPIIPPVTARFLEAITTLCKPERALEIGTAIGYSAIVVGRHLPPWGNLETIEKDPATADRALRNLAEAGLKGKVIVHKGAALEVIPKLENRYDLVFIDAAKEEYAAYLRLILPLVPKGGTILVDNLLWGGGTAAPASPSDDAATTALRRFNEVFLAHPELLAQVLPVGDGLGMAVKV